MIMGMAVVAPPTPLLVLPLVTTGDAPPPTGFSAINWARLLEAAVRRGGFTPMMVFAGAMMGSLVALVVARSCGDKTAAAAAPVAGM